MESTIPTANTHTAQSLNGDSSRGNSYGAMHFNQNSDSGKAGKENRLSNTVAVKWHHTNEPQNSTFREYFKDLPISTRRMSPAIATQTHQSYAQHATETLNRAEADPISFSNLAYSTSKSANYEVKRAGNATTIERWERSHNLYQHPIIASRASMQLTLSNVR